VGIVIPNLLHWNSSVICLDIKGENFDKTSGYRAGFSQIYKFDPFSLSTHAYNPLSYINRDGVSTISDIQTMARILWPINDTDPIWHDSACNLFQGLVLYLLDMERHELQNLNQNLKPEQKTPITLFSVFNIAGQLGGYDTAAWQQLKNQLPFQVSPRTMSSLNNYFTLPQETRTSVLGTFNAQMQIFANPTVIAATSGDDFSLKNIRKQKMSIYVCVTPNRLSQASKLLNIFFSQLIQLNSDELPEQNPELKETALILLDEFTALGKVDIIEKAISYIAGYNLRLLLIYQSQSQLASVYGEESAKNIVTNCGCQILFAPREQKDAEEYSQMLGKTTIQIQNHSYNQGGKDASGRNISINQQERALMLPQELKQMGARRNDIDYYFRRLPTDQSTKNQVL
jgi:type IV secretion system protein VirD4